MHLIIDFGNTQAKIAVFDGNEMIRFESYPSLDLIRLKSDFDLESFDGVLLASVIDHDPDLEAYINSLPGGHVVSASSQLPFTNTYGSPSSLGVDRMANAAALRTRYSGRNALCIDMGTCIKYDFVDRSGAYLGGAISPGFGMRFSALNTFTDKLPLIEPQATKDFIGTDTNSSMVSGVFQGIVAELNGVIMNYIAKFGDVEIVMTGGDASFFENEVKNSIFADAFFTLRGLNAILKVNAD